MKEKIEKWIAEIDEATELFRTEFSGLSEEQLNWKPSPEVWSIAQILEHIVITNISYYPHIERIKSGSYKLPVTSKLSFLVRQFGNIILKSVNRNNQKKIKTMPVWKPVSSSIAGDVIGKFANQQTDLKMVISSCEDLLNKNTLISSPANKFIVYKLERAFDIIVEHEFRHYGQAAEIKLNLQ
jgi:uncharacterized damage-inducible protein DinB